MSFTAFKICVARKIKKHGISLKGKDMTILGEIF